MADFFKINGKKLTKLEENKSKIKIEKDIQNLVEINISHIFQNVILIESEFILEGLRMDSLCYDLNSNSFLIIEYKNVKNRSVIDQAFSYIHLLESNKHEVTLKLNKKLKKNKDVLEINWDNTKTVIISREFTNHQIHSSQKLSATVSLITFNVMDDVLIFDSPSNNEDGVNNESSVTKVSAIKEIKKKGKMEKSYPAYFKRQRVTPRGRKLFSELKTKLKKLSLKDEVWVNYIKFLTKDGQEVLHVSGSYFPLNDYELSIHYHHIKNSNLKKELKKLGSDVSYGSFSHYIRNMSDVNSVVKCAKLILKYLEK